MRISIIIRTLNEARYLAELLQATQSQALSGNKPEVVIVDSGSNDGTLEIARRYNCRIQHISREEFSFGRSLNIGCEVAIGDILVFISGHCVPADNSWLQNLCQPLVRGQADYVYGRQVGGPESFYSECRIFSKYFPERSRIPQEGFFCNNANSALTRTAWESYRFNEDLTGLEDMELALRLNGQGGKVAYVADACVYHYHNESWQQIARRFEREALALQHILPQVHIHKLDLVRYVISSIWIDWRSAWLEKKFFSKAMEIVLYRFWQYWGSFRGNNIHRKLSHAEKDVYFYPSSSPHISKRTVINGAVGPRSSGTPVERVKS